MFSWVNASARVRQVCRWSVCLSVFVLGLGDSSTDAADLPLARLDGVSPASVPRGGETDVTVAGADLEGAETAWFSHAGITAVLKKDKTFTVKADSSVPEGIYDIRVFGTHGISNPKAFYVDRCKTALKAGECSITKPMEIRPGEAVQGAAVAAARDYYRFAAVKDQRLVIRCQTQEIDSRLVPVFAVLDSSGRKLASNERRDFIEFKAPESASYLVSVHDSAFAGGADMFYRLLVDEAPVVEAVVPSAIHVGKKNRVEVLGRGIAGATPSRLKGADGRVLEALGLDVEPARVQGVDGATVLASAGVETWSFRMESPKGLANPMPLLLVSEEMPVKVPEDGKAVALAVPGCVSGLFGRGYAGIPIEFEAKKGEVLVAEIFSNRLGERKTNPYLRIVKGEVFVGEAYAPEANVGGNRLSTLHNDPLLRFECKEDGKYTLLVSDLSGATRSGLGARFALTLKREEPGFALLAATEPPPETANDRAIQPRGCVLRAGGTAMLRVIALRSPGFTGEIDLAAENLPAGVTCSPGRILAGKTEAALVLRAQPDVARSLTSIRVVGRSQGGRLEKQARWATARWSVVDSTLNPHEPRLARDLGGILLATTDSKAPLVLAPEEKTALDVVQGAKLDIPVRLQRSSEFQIPLKIKTGGFAGAETIKEVDIDAKAETAKVQIDTAALKLGAGKHLTYFSTQAKAKVSGRDVVTTVFSPAVEITVRAPEGAAASKAGSPPQPAAGAK